MPKSYIELRENTSWMGKRYIAVMWKNWKVVAFYPANRLSDIDLSYFEK